MTRPILKKHRKLSESISQSEGLARKQKQLGAQIACSSGTAVPHSQDPVYYMINNFTTKFDAVGRQRAAALGGERSDSEMLGERSPEQGSATGEGSTLTEERQRQLRRQHDSPVYRHSGEQLENGSFTDRFASYAFNGGNMAASVISGQGRQMFTSCLSRALGRPVPSSEKQKRILMQNAIENNVDGTAAKVVFNRHAQSAVGIVLDSIRGASSAFEAFKKLANESGAIKDTPMEHYNIETMKALYPYLVTAKDKKQLSEYNAQLKALENDTSPQAAESRRAIQWARDRQRAMLDRKAAEQRKLLTVLTRAQSNLKEAEKLFSSDGFVESILEEIDRLEEDIPPEDNNKSGVDMLDEFLTGVFGNAEQADFAQPEGEQTAEQQGEQLPQQQRTENQQSAAGGSASGGGRR